jgi:methylglutaconyl-CoA hydratase
MIASSSDPVRVRKDLPSGTIIIDREDRCNALSGRALVMLEEAIQDFSLEKKVRAIILTGANKWFCSGTDLKEIHVTAEDQEAHKLWHESAEQLRSLIETMLLCPKPIIAAVNGIAAGFGAALVFASDLTLFGNDASLWLPESRRGLIAGLTLPLVAFRIGTASALRLGIANGIIDAETAKQLGLATDVVPDNLLWVKAQELATEIAKSSPQSALMTKQLVNQTIGEALMTQLSIGAANTATMRTTESAKIGVQSFLDKTDPEWP